MIRLSPSLVAQTVSLALAFAAPALAQTPPTRDPAQIQAGTYAVDPGHTQVGWRVSHMGFSNYAGGFSDVSGTLELQPKNPASAKLSVKIPVASVTTTSAKLTDELKRAVDEAMDSGRPTLINAVIDPQAGSESGNIGSLNPQSQLKKKA